MTIFICELCGHENCCQVSAMRKLRCWDCREKNLTGQSCSKSLGVESVAVNSQQNFFVFLSTYFFVDDYINNWTFIASSEKKNRRDCRTSLRVNLPREAARVQFICEIVSQFIWSLIELNSVCLLKVNEITYWNEIADSVIGFVFICLRKTSVFISG